MGRAGGLGLTRVRHWSFFWMTGQVGSHDDGKFTPTKHLTPPPSHHSSQPAAAHTDTETPLLHQKEG